MQRSVLKASTALLQGQVRQRVSFRSALSIGNWDRQTCIFTVAGLQTLPSHPTTSGASPVAVEQAPTTITGGFRGTLGFLPATSLSFKPDTFADRWWLAFKTFS